MIVYEPGTTFSFIIHNFSTIWSLLDLWYYMIRPTNLSLIYMTANLTMNYTVVLYVSHQ